MVSQSVCNAAIQNKIAETMLGTLRRSTLEDTCIGKVMGRFYNLLLGKRTCPAVAVVVTECRCVNIRTFSGPSSNVTILLCLISERNKPVVGVGDIWRSVFIMPSNKG